MAAVLQLFAPAKNRGQRRALTRLHRPVAPAAREPLTDAVDRRGHRDVPPHQSTPRVLMAQAATTLGWASASAGHGKGAAPAVVPKDQAVVLDLFGQPPVIFHRIYVELTGSVTAALWFSHAMDRLSRNPRAEGEFDMTLAECQALTGLTRREQETARAKLRDAGLITEARRPGCIRYRVDLEALSQRLMDQSGQRWTAPAAFTSESAAPTASSGKGTGTHA